MVLEACPDLEFLSWKYLIDPWDISKQFKSEYNHKIKQ